MKKLGWPTKNNKEMTEKVHEEFSVKNSTWMMMNLFIMSATVPSLVLHVDGLLHTFSLIIYLTYQIFTF